MLPLKQVELDVISQLTTSPLIEYRLKRGLFVPTLIPLTFHTKLGFKPPFTGVAVKVTRLPVQNGFVGVAMDTLAGIALLTCMVTGKDVAGLLLTHEAFEIIWQITTFPFEGVNV